MTRLPLACPQFFLYWLSVDTKATSRILEKKAKNRGTTTHTWYNLDCHAPPNKPQWNPEKTTTNSVLWACVVQAVNKSKKKTQKKLARGRKAA
jgi:hypothetical protein